MVDRIMLTADHPNLIRHERHGAVKLANRSDDDEKTVLVGRGNSSRESFEYVSKELLSRGRQFQWAV